MNYRFTDDEAAYVIGHSDATVVYVDAELGPDARPHPRRRPGGRSVLVFDGPCPESDDGWFATADELIAAAPGHRAAARRRCG